MFVLGAADGDGAGHEPILRGRDAAIGGPKRLKPRGVSADRKSGADQRGFRMDFVPKTDQLPGGKAAAAIDSLFAFAENGADGKPIRADFWNRAWIYCEHAVSAIELEALLFGRRRRLDPTQAGA